MLGNYLQPYAYAQMQVVEQAVNRVGKVDQAALAADMHASNSRHRGGRIRFGAIGEWAEPRNLWSSSRTSATATWRSTSAPAPR